MAELALDHPEWMLDLRTYAGLWLLDLVDHHVDLVALVQRPTFAWAQSDTPVHAQPVIGPAGRALVTRISEGNALLQAHCGPRYADHL